MAAARSVAADYNRGTNCYPGGDVESGVLEIIYEPGLSNRGTIRYENGDVYKGELKDGQEHGKGIRTCGNGDVCDCEWKDGEPHGKGIMKWKDGRCYDGQFDNGREHGKGTFKWKDGRIYVGEFVEGFGHGWGTATFANGNVYEGQWVEGKESGTGTKSFANGDVYEGQWLEGRPHGKGIIKYASGDTYEGVWADGQREKTGTMKWANGDTQTGRFDRPGGCKLRSQRSQQRRLEADKKACEHCGADDYRYKLRVCSGCNLALYCSLTCQEAARGSHRRICDISSQLPSRDSDRLVLEYNRDKMIDLDAGLRYGAKYMDEMTHLGIDLADMMDEGDAIKLSAKQLSSLLWSKKDALETFFWSAARDINVPGITQNGEVWKELRGLKQLYLRSIAFDESQPICDIIHQQSSALLVLSLPDVIIGWHRAKTRRAIAHAVGSCKHLVKLDLSGSVLMDSDLKVMLHDLPNIRILHLERLPMDRHEFTDNTCGLIARKCSGLQELSLHNHDHLSVRGIRKIFAGCVHLRLFQTSSLKLSCADVRNLLDIAPQLLSLTLGSNKSYASDGGMLDIIEATGGRTLVRFSSPSTIYVPGALSAESRETYESQIEALRRIKSKRDDLEVANEWEEMFEG